MMRALPLSPPSNLDEGAVTVVLTSAYFSVCSI